MKGLGKRAGMTSEPNTTEAQASEWVVRRDAGLTQRQQTELKAWLAADRRNHGAYIRAQAAWHDADRLAAIAAGGVNEKPHAVRYRQVWLAAASIAAIALLGTTAWFLTSRAGQTYASEIGEVRNIELP